LETGEGAPTAPASDLGAIRALVEQARAAGLQTELNVQLDGVEIPSAVGQAAHRTVQEALTNVVRHAKASRACVTIKTGSGMLDIDVVDDGQASVLNGSAGHGLRGMHERASALEGWVETGPCREGGWRVHALLPLGGRNSP
jgi:signal transduction histidine kinase